MHVLNSKEMKKLLASIREQFGEFKTEGYAFFRNNEDKVFILSRKFADLDDSLLRINNLGLYFCKEEKDGIRLSIEGAQLVNPKLNVIDMSKEQMYAWMRGEDIEVGDDGRKCYVVVKHDGDIFGCGKLKEGVVMNSVAKGRRVIGIAPGDKTGIRTIKLERK